MTEDHEREPLTLDEEATRRARRVAARAILRLQLIELGMLVVVVGVCLVAGAALAFILAEPLGLSFRVTWAGASLLLITIPALLAWQRERGSP